MLLNSYQRMLEFLKICLAALVSYLALFISAKLVGRKQISQLDFMDYITGITIRIDGGLALPSIPEWFAPAQWLDERWADNQKDIAFGEKERT